MKLLRLLSIVVFIAITTNLFSQSEEYMFNHFKSAGEKNVVFFRISGLSDDTDEQDRVLSIILEDSKITDGRIFSVEGSNPTCQIEVNPEINVAYIRNLLQSAGYDIDLTSVSSKNPEKPAGIYSSERYSFFEGFSGFENYDPNTNGALSPEEHYAKEKEAWVNKNPEAYEKAKTENGTAIVVRRKDFESFTPEKRQHMLNHPEMFIIED